jgi:hypothetical protein
MGKELGDGAGQDRLSGKLRSIQDFTESRLNTGGRTMANSSFITSSRRDFLTRVGATAVGTGLGIVSTAQSFGKKATTELSFLSATALARLIANREVSAVETAEAYLSRIAEVNPKLNAIVQMDSERVLGDARQADAELKRGDRESSTSWRSIHDQG